MHPVEAHSFVPGVHQLSRAHLASQRLKEQAQSLHGSAQVPFVNVMAVSLVGCETPNSGSGYIPDSFAFY